MRRGSSTVVALVGDISADLLSRINKPSNVSVLDPPAKGVEGSFEAFSRAGRLLTTYAVVASDPLEEVASEWRKMWTVGSPGNLFEERAGEAVVAWRSERLELPDYYLVVLNEPTPSVQASTTEPHQYDFYLGVLRSERPSRVAEVVAAETAETAARTLQALAQLRQGPWWPPVDRLIESIRSFFPGQLAAGANLTSEPDNSSSNGPGRPVRGVVELGQRSS